MFNQHAKERYFSNGILETESDGVYFGQVKSADPSHEKEITRRISTAWAALGKNYDMLTHGVSPSNTDRRKL